MVVLYRKYRPKFFNEVIGQEHVVQTLNNAVAFSSISHAYLFCGPRGSGKTTIARLLAKALNCENRNDGQFEPCGKCSSCQEITNGNAMDLIEIDAASHRGIDDIRELRDGVRILPVKSKFKVFIIDECHQLSKDASNALLKTLEEPPSHVIFILATTDVHKMLPTIISRCQRFDFKRLQTPDIIKKLEYIANKEEVKFDKSALSLIALNARGSFRDAESLLDECLGFCGKNKNIRAEDVEKLLGVIEISHISKFVDLLLEKNAKDAILFIDSLIDGGVDIHEFAKTLVFYLREALLTKINPDFLKPELTGLSQEETEKLKLQTSKLSEKEIQKILELFIDAENKIKYASIPQLPIELAIVDIVNP